MYKSDQALRPQEILWSVEPQQPSPAATSPASVWRKRWMFRDLNRICAYAFDRPVFWLVQSRGGLSCGRTLYDKHFRRQSPSLSSPFHTPTRSDDGQILPFAAFELAASSGESAEKGLLGCRLAPIRSAVPIAKLHRG